MTPLRAVIVLGLAAMSFATGAHADDPFFKGKRLTILINFAAGGPTDIEGRLFAKHLTKHMDGAPSIVIQNMDGAGGIVGAKYLGEVAPRDGTMAGYFTGTAFMYALDPSRFRVDFKNYAFVAMQPGTTVHFARTDIEPGMKQATDIMNAKGLIVGGLSVDTPKDIRLRLAMDMLGIPFKYVTGYRSSPAARLAFQRGEINFFSESPPSYRGVIEPNMVKTGQAIPIFYDAGFDGKDFFVPEAVKGLPILQYHELYQKLKGTMPSGQYWEDLQGYHQRRRDYPARDGHAARCASRGGRGAPRRHHAGEQRQRLCGGRTQSVRLRAAMAGLPRHAEGCAGGALREAGGQSISYQLHEEPAGEVTICNLSRVKGTFSR